VKAIRPGRAVSQRLEAAGFEAVHPLPNRLEANPESGGDSSRRLSFKDHTAYDLSSTMGSGAGILVDVHSA
jgi:hypothetical protein